MVTIFDLQLPKKSSPDKMFPCQLVAIVTPPVFTSSDIPKRGGGSCISGGDYPATDSKFQICILVEALGREKKDRLDDLVCGDQVIIITEEIILNLGTFGDE